ncbi:MAG: hypothetical protein COB97_01375 [Paracoccus sp.]|nr:MAG: hypothetical protein COB97_01375 [Paracoccus sp. (in: a-proteobacteria)]
MVFPKRGSLLAGILKERRRGLVAGSASLKKDRLLVLERFRGWNSWWGMAKPVGNGIEEGWKGIEEGWGR